MSSNNERTGCISSNDFGSSNSFEKCCGTFLGYVPDMSSVKKRPLNFARGWDRPLPTKVCAWFQFWNPECKQRTIWYHDKLWKSSVWIFGNCSFDKNFINAHDEIAEYLRRYTEPFEVADNIVKQFPIKEIKLNQKNGGVPFPKEVKSNICRIADKIKGVTICLIMPCIVEVPNTHLLSVHGEKRKHLWPTFHRIHCLPLTSNYGIILLSY